MTQTLESLDLMVWILEYWILKKQVMISVIWTQNGIEVKLVLAFFSRYLHRKALVSQEPVLFATTIRENIIYGTERVIDEDEITDAGMCFWDIS